jgi:hypothetical protein
VLRVLLQLEHKDHKVLRVPQVFKGIKEFKVQLEQQVFREPRL